MNSPEVSRRRAIALGVGGIAGAGLAGCASGRTPARTQEIASRPVAQAPVPTPTAPPEPVGWQIGVGGCRVSTDAALNLAAYASADSVDVGGSIAFHLSATPAQLVTGEIFRLGGPLNTATRMLTSEPVKVVPRAAPISSRLSKTVTCGWPVAWQVTIPRTWRSGIYVAAFTGDAGYQTYATLVVREDTRRAEIQVVLPTTTYQAYNLFRADGVTGASLYHAWDSAGRMVDEDACATKVSFDRPYVSPGLPLLFDLDRLFAEWALGQGLDVKFATSVDLHAGRIDPSTYRTMVFSGHDEYWSQQMRSQVEHAAVLGRNLAFMAANSIYWHIRLQDWVDGAAATVTCYKHRYDPAPDSSGATTQWRQLGRPEQRFLGSQYVSMIDGTRPLVVHSADHWFWRGTGVREGDAIPRLIWGEADNVDPSYAGAGGTEHAVLAASPYLDGHQSSRLQNTVLHRHPGGGLIFVAGTFNWNRGLADPAFQDVRVQRATANLFQAFATD